MNKREALELAVAKIRDRIADDIAGIEMEIESLQSELRPFTDLIEMIDDNFDGLLENFDPDDGYVSEKARNLKREIEQAHADKDWDKVADLHPKWLAEVENMELDVQAIEYLKSVANDEGVYL